MSPRPLWRGGGWGEWGLDLMTGYLGVFFQGLGLLFLSPLSFSGEEHGGVLDSHLLLGSSVVFRNFGGIWG